MAGQASGVEPNFVFVSLRINEAPNSIVNRSACKDRLKVPITLSVRVAQAVNKFKFHIQKVVIPTILPLTEIIFETGNIQDKI
jgi:hypothetical protein